MKNQSYWQLSVKPLVFETLHQSQEDEVSIIGGGLTGIMCAYYLRQSGLKVSVYEAEEFGSGSTGHTTAKITYQHGLIYSQIEQLYDLDEAIRFYTVNKNAIEEIASIVEREKISCDFEWETLRICGSPSQKKNIEKEVDVLRRMGVSLVYDEKECFFEIEHQAKFHPLKYLYALIQICAQEGIRFYPRTKITQIQAHDFSYTLKTERGDTIHTNHLVLATRYPIREVPSFYSVKLYQERDFVCMGQTDDLPSYMYFYQEPLKSMRSYQNHLIYVCQGARVGSPMQSEAYLKDQLKENESFYPNISWYNQDVYSQDPIPYIGHFSRKDDYCYMATNYRGWGMTSATIAGKLISDLILHRSNDYLDLFEPSFHFFKGKWKPWFSHIGYVMNSEIHDRLFSQGKDKQVLEKGEGRILRIHGKLKGVYLDEQGQYHMVDPICPHFNKQEKTWDCPCHGSRFDIDGQLLDGPSRDNLKTLD